MRPWSRWRMAPLAGFGLVALVSSALLLQWGLGPESGDVQATDPPPQLTAVRVDVPDEERRARVLSLAVDLWSESDAGPTLDVVLEPQGMAALRAEGIPLEVLSPDIMADAAAEKARLASAEAARPGNWFAEYRNYETVDARLDTLVARRPDLAQVETLGTSSQGRRIRALRITAAGPDAPAIVVNGGQHAREWISVMVSTCVADRLVTEYDSDPRVSAVLDRHAVWVAPVINPDGYVYSWESERYWRKNRQEPYGVDLNRNWSVGFGGRGSSSNRRSQIYRGPHAFSEPETQALRNLISREPVAAHVDFHSYGQLILYPWSHTKKPAPERERHAALGDAMASAIYSAHGVPYRLMPAQDLYMAGGTALDWSYGDRGAMGFTIELRPKGGSGFVLPPEQIVPTCDEGFAAVLALAEALGR